MKYEYLPGRQLIAAWLKTQLHPLRTLERCALILMALHLAYGRGSHRMGIDSFVGSHALCPIGKARDPPRERHRTGLYC